MTRNWLTRDEVRDVDRRAVEEFGLPGIVLMENAGRGCADRIVEVFRLTDRSHVAICCGKGNNGGDGYVIARHLDNRGIPVEIVMVCPPDELRGDAAINFKVVERSQLPITVAPSANDWQALRLRLERSDLIVDALLGTGFVGMPRDPLAAAIRTMNDSARPIVSIDLPSGLDADTGTAPGECIRAARTLTFVALKKGFLAAESAKFTGEVEVVSIGVPRRLLTSLRLDQELPVPPGTVFASG